MRPRVAARRASGYSGFSLPCCERPRWSSACLKYIKHQWRSRGGTPQGALSHRGIKTHIGRACLDAVQRANMRSILVAIDEVILVQSIDLLGL